MLDRNAVVIGDGGDFVSFAGRVIETYEPGCWMDPGPYGCLGAGPGFALAAKLAHPERQVCLLLGDGAFGFSGLEFDTFVRLGVPVVGVMGNNGIWALEKHPMEYLYGYSVAAELQPGCRYDEVVRALGGHGELVSSPDELRPALERAFASGQAGAGERAHRPRGRLPAQGQPGLKSRTARIMRAVPKTAPSGRAGVRALKGPCGSDGGRRRYDAASPEPMYQVGTIRLPARQTPPSARHYRPLACSWEGPSETKMWGHRLEPAAVDRLAPKLPPHGNRAGLTAAVAHAGSGSACGAARRAARRPGSSGCAPPEAAGNSARAAGCAYGRRRHGR